MAAPGSGLGEPRSEVALLIVALAKIVGAVVVVIAAVVLGFLIVMSVIALGSLALMLRSTD